MFHRDLLNKNQSEIDKLKSDLALVILDRNEWRTQHENLLSVRQSDLDLIADLKQQIASMKEAEGKEG